MKDRRALLEKNKTFEICFALSKAVRSTTFLTFLFV